MQPTTTDAIQRPTAVPRDERGAALVEFAIIAPLLFFIFFGLIEASWAFSQQLEIRHGARETVRLAATDYGDLNTIVTEGCKRMDYTTGGAQVTLASSGPAIGESVRVTVEAPLQTLTGVLDPIFGGLTVASSAEMRIERTASWSDGVLPCP
jgi:Flp pilus assembly protein TadG